MVLEEKTNISLDKYILDIDLVPCFVKFDRQRLCPSHQRENARLDKCSHLGRTKNRYGLFYGQPGCGKQGMDKRKQIGDMVWMRMSDKDSVKGAESSFGPVELAKDIITR